jgi:hypothetical protein
MKLQTTLARAALVLVLGAAVTGCPTDPPDGKDASIALALASSGVSVAQGASGTVNVTITRSDFTGDVTLTVDGLPTGVTAAFAPASLADGTTSSTLTLTVGASVAPGDVGLTIKANGAGVTEKTQLLTLTVTVAGAYTLSMTPTSRTLNQGGSATATINVNRTGGFAGSVALAVSGAPSGLTATIAPSSATGTTATLTLSRSTPRARRPSARRH